MRNAGRQETRIEPGLHVCPACGSHLVQPVSWEQAEERGHWHLLRRCPECEWRGQGTHGEVHIEAYDLELDSGTEELDHGLRVLARENMERLTESFTRALYADLITAEDFV